MASWKPPPSATRSWRNRKASRRLDLPEAFGPIRNTRPCSATCTRTKFLQFASRSCANRGALELFDFIPAALRVRVDRQICIPRPPPRHRVRVVTPAALVVAGLPKTRSGKILRGHAQDRRGKGLPHAGDDRRPGGP